MVIQQQQIIKQIIVLLETNISDLATDRKALNKKWIYEDTPRLDITSYPRISVTPVSSSFSSLGIGQPDFLEDLTINIEIRTRRTDKFNVPILGVQRSEGVISFLKSEVERVLRDNRDLFINSETLYIIPLTSSRSIVESLVIDSLNFRVLVI